MIDRSKLPDFIQDMPEERLKEITEEDYRAECFAAYMDKMLHTNKKKQGRKKGRKKGKN